MSWGLVAGAVVGGVVSYVGTDKTNKANAKLAKGQGDVNTTTTRDPYGASVPYRDAGAQAAYEALFGPGAVPGGEGQRVQGAPAAAAPPARTGKAAGGQTVVTQGGVQGVMGKGGKFQPLGKNALAKAGGGGTPGAAAPAPFAGMSGETDTIRRSMMGLPAQNAAMFDAAEDYTTGTLAGEERNPLRDRAASAADDIAEDPGLAEYINALKGGLGLGGSTSGGQKGGGMGGRYVSYGPAAGASSAAGGGGQNNYTSATGADAALRKLIAGEDAPGLKAAEDAVSRRVAEKNAADVRELRGRAVGSGFYGGSVYQDLESSALAKGDQELAAELAQARFGAYSNALGLGTQYDLGMADMASRERIASSNASAAGAGASADAESRERLATLGLWGDALQLGEQGRFGRASQLGDLAGQSSTDQRAALGGINDLGSSRRNDLSAAGQLSLGADQNRNSYAASRGSERVGLAGVGLGRAELAFDKEKFYDPFSRIGAYTDILNGTYGAYGSETTQGRDTRSSPAAPYSSPLGGALTGAAIGGQVGSAFSGSGRKKPAPGGGGSFGGGGASGSW